MNNDHLEHFGVLGMHWGRRSGTRTSVKKTDHKISKDKLKLIKERKNDMLNKVVETDMHVEYHLMSTKYKVSEQQAMSSTSKAVVDSHMSEKAAKANAYIEKNPSVVPKGMTVHYDPKKYDGDDLTLQPDYTYNGREVSFSSSKNDDAFLEPPREINHYYVDDNELIHYGKLGMKWGQRHAVNKLNKTAKKDATKHEVARQAYGKGAGIQRRLVKKDIEEKMKNPQYKAAYDKALSEINYAKINNKAIANSRGRATKDQASRSAAIVAKTLTGTTSLAAGYILYTQNKPAIDHAVGSALKKAKTAFDTYQTAQQWKKNFG